MLNQNRGRKFTNKDGLTPFQSQFICLYTNPNSACYLNGTQSALRTYNTSCERTAASIASENLRKPNISKAIKDKLQEKTIDSLLTSGIIERLRDPLSPLWIQTANFVAKIRGDFAPENIKIIELSKDDRDKHLDKIEALLIQHNGLITSD